MVKRWGSLKFDSELDSELGLKEKMPVPSFQTPCSDRVLEKKMLRTALTSKVNNKVHYKHFAAKTPKLISSISLCHMQKVKNFRSRLTCPRSITMCRYQSSCSY